MLLSIANCHQQKKNLRHTPEAHLVLLEKFRLVFPGDVIDTSEIKDEGLYNFKRPTLILQTLHAGEQFSYIAVFLEGAKSTTCD